MVLVSSLDWLGLVFICGVVQYNYHIEILLQSRNPESYSGTLTILTFFTHYFEYSVSFIVFLLILVAYCVFSKPDVIKRQNIPYQKIEYMFPKNYETENPITKYKGQLRYLSGIFRNNVAGAVLSKEGKVINELLDMGKKSTMNLAQNKGEITKIKRKIMRKLTIASQSDD